MFGYTMKTKYMNLAFFWAYFLSLQVTENFPSNFFFEFLIPKFSFWRILPVEARGSPHPPLAESLPTTSKQCFLYL